MSAFKPTEELIAESRDRIRIEDREYERAKIENITLKNALADVGEAVAGVSNDVFTSRLADPWTVVSDGNRLRGLGFLLMACASVGLLILAFFSPPSYF